MTPAPEDSSARRPDEEPRRAMSSVDIDSAVAAELAVLQAEHVALKREHQRLETGRDDLAAYRAHGLKLVMHQQRLSDFSTRLRRGDRSGAHAKPPACVS